jgi:hypothetical protein
VDGCWERGEGRRERGEGRGERGEGRRERGWEGGVGAMHACIA